MKPIVLHERADEFAHAWVVNHVAPASQACGNPLSPEVIALGIQHFSGRSFQCSHVGGLVVGQLQPLLGTRLRLRRGSGTTLPSSLTDLPTLKLEGRVVSEPRLDKSCVFVGPITVKSGGPVRVSAWKPTSPDDGMLVSLTGTELPTEAGLACQPSSQMGASGWVVDYGQASRRHSLARCNEVQASYLYRMSVAQAVACCFARPWFNADGSLADWKRACVMHFDLETTGLGNDQLDSNTAAIPTVRQHKALPISCLAFSYSCGYKGVFALDPGVKQAYPNPRDLWRLGGELDGASENSGWVLMMAPSSLAVVECFRAVLDNNRPLILSGWNIELYDLMCIADHLVSTEYRLMLFDYSRLSGSGDARARLPHLVLAGWWFNCGSSKWLNLGWA